MSNWILNEGLIFETIIAVVVAYPKPLQYGLKTRSIASPHFLIPGFMYFCIILFYDETRKIYVRAGIDRSVKGKVKYVGWLARNTYW